MRKIEREIVNSISTCISQKDSFEKYYSLRDSVEARYINGVYTISVYLHGSDIATVECYNDKIIVTVKPCDFFTVTTKSRLNAILDALVGVQIKQVNYKWLVYYTNSSHYEQELTSKAVFTIEENMLVKVAIE